MNKLKLLTVAFFVTSLMSLSVMAAEVRVGVSAGFAQIEVDGS